MKLRTLLLVGLLSSIGVGCSDANEVVIPDISEAANEPLATDQIVGGDGSTPTKKGQRDMAIPLGN